MNEQEPGSIYAVYADDKYINAIVSNKILLEQGKAKSFYSDGVVLENGKHIEADVVVLATGYHRAYEFLSKNIKRIVKYDSGKPGLSMSLFRSIFHPDLPKLCFVGNIRAFVPARYELQAIVGIRFMLGKLDLSYDRLIQGVHDEDFIRTNTVEQDYDPKSYLYDILQIVDPEISCKILKSELKFNNGMFLPQFIGIDNPEQLEKCKNVIEEIKFRHPDYICE